MKIGIFLLVIGSGDILFTAIVAGTFAYAMPRLLVDIAFIGIGLYRLWRWSKKPSKKKV